MARHCSVCHHELAHVVNVALVSREPYRAVARQYGLSKDALRRHAQEHIPELLVKAREAGERSDADDLLEELKRIGERLDRLSDLAEADGDYRTAIGGQGVLLKRVDLLARVRQIIQEAPTINLSLNPEWLELRAAITVALEPHEEARRAVLVAIQGVGAAMLSGELASSLDRVAFAGSAGLGLDLDPWQRDLLRSTSKRVLLNITRQGGKSTMCAVLALHRALHHPRSLVLCLSPSLRQSSELFKKATSLYRDLGRPVPSESETALTLTLSNGSRIVSLPGSEGKIRGYSGVSLLVVDEAARVDDELYMSVRPMLAVSGGSLILASTPWGKRGAFHREWTEGQGWERFEVPASECPRISAEFLAEEARALGPRWYRQEYLCQFEETEDSVFDYETVDSAISDEIKPLFSGPIGTGPGRAAPAPQRSPLVPDGEPRPLFGGLR